MEQHYLDGLSLTRCARLAMVSPATMTAWLLRFEIRIRTIGEQLLVNNLASPRERA